MKEYAVCTWCTMAKRGGKVFAEYSRVTEVGEAFVRMDY
jgi:hypothetical protein